MGSDPAVPINTTALAVRDRLAGAGRWLVWHPWRLGVFLLVVLLVWMISAALRHDPDTTQTPSSPSGIETAPDGDRLPEGWRTWPAVPATRTPGGAG